MLPMNSATTDWVARSPTSSASYPAMTLYGRINDYTDARSPRPGFLSAFLALFLHDREFIAQTEVL